jgi:hypothetical protein
MNAGTSFPCTTANGEPGCVYAFFLFYYDEAGNQIEVAHGTELWLWYWGGPGQPIFEHFFTYNAETNLHCIPTMNLPPGSTFPIYWEQQNQLDGIFYACTEIEVIDCN